MQKIFAIAIGSMFVFSACTSTVPEPAEISQNIIDKCLTIPDRGESDNCLMKTAADMVYYKTYESDIQVCQKMSKDLPYYQECYWLFAFSLKDPAICEFLPEKSRQAELEDQWFSGSIDYLTEDNCKKEFNLKTEDSEWKLISGIPPMADPERLSYKGNATINGWMIKKTGYGDELISYFHVDGESFKKLPLSISRNKFEGFVLKEKGLDLTVETLGKLEVYGNKNPAAIKISGIEIAAEGPPLLYLEEIMN